MRGDRRSDQQLLRATEAGDLDAFGELFSCHAESVLVFLRRRVGSAEAAADLVAETFAAALLAAHNGNAGHVPNGRAWLLGIARHKLIDSYRAARVQDSARRTIGLASVPVHDHDLERIDELAGRDNPASEALERLAAPEREAIVARILEERDYEEIAGDLRQSETTIRKRVSRGLARLRKQMGAEPR